MLMRFTHRIAFIVPTPDGPQSWEPPIPIGDWVDAPAWITEDSTFSRHLGNGDIEIFQDPNANPQSPASEPESPASLSASEDPITPPSEPDPTYEAPPANPGEEPHDLNPDMVDVDHP